MSKLESQVGELTAELARLNELVRKRRKQLEFLERCPNKQCECRAVWWEVVEKDLAGQVGRINRQIRGDERNGEGKSRKPGSRR